MPLLRRDWLHDHVVRRRGNCNRYLFIRCLGEFRSPIGHYGHTCWNVAGVCPDGAKFIHIACPAPFVYMNEAHNSWTLIGEGSGFDTYGQGNPAERAFCDRHR